MKRAVSGDAFPSEILRAHSDNRALNSSEWCLIYFVTHTKASSNEPEELRKARHRIAIAKCAGDHLLNVGLSPIIESFSFEALRQGKE